MSLTRYISDFVNENPGKSVGAFSGLILGVLILTFGFWRTVVIILFIILGFIIGKMIDDGDSGIEAIKNIFRRR
ncbi:MAG TPA: DUF2273 domain-containing protein [Spirochaetota bacterium]|nr:DUF2273 domain-containing protein [Spirochaetota bacterium]